MIQVKILGRSIEQKRVKNALRSKESEFVLVTGRRRVGKTFFILKAFEQNLIFHLTGQKDTTTQVQLNNFFQKLEEYSPKTKWKKPANWREAFDELKKYILTRRSSKKPVIFFDELPWLCNPKSDFLSALDYFWNSWAAYHNIILVVSGSAASWMIKNIINDKGGLHNRATLKLHLQPFDLNETHAFLKSRKIEFPLYDLVMIYMALGGIPYYLKEIIPGESATQNIARVCFGKNAPLFQEFDNLYAALFRNAENHIKVVKALASKWKGLSRNEIIKLTSIENGGGLSTTLNELEQSSFITTYAPFGKLEREKLYRLTDEYSLFYLSFLEKVNYGTTSYWMKMAQTPVYKSWLGYSFESFCLKHIDFIKHALGISGIYTQQASFFKIKSPNSQGVQIDLIIDRNDNAINLCEIKYYNSEFILDAKEAKQMRIKREIFRHSTGTKKYLINTLIASHMAVESKLPEVDKLITLKDIFKLNK